MLDPDVASGILSHTPFVWADTGAYMTRLGDDPLSEARVGYGDVLIDCD